MHDHEEARHDEPGHAEGSHAHDHTAGANAKMLG